MEKLTKIISHVHSHNKIIEEKRVWEAHQKGKKLSQRGKKSNFFSYIWYGHWPRLSLKMEYCHYFTNIFRTPN